MDKRRMLFFGLAVAFLAVGLAQVRSRPGVERGAQPGAVAPDGSSGLVSDEPPLRVRAERRGRELEIEVAARDALQGVNVVVQRFEGAAASAAATDTTWSGDLGAGASQRVAFPLPSALREARFVVTARGTAAGGGRVAATAVVPPETAP
jgi:hypothetical protein